MSRPDRRLAGVDVARALAMLGMLLEHALRYPVLEPKGALWSVYGRSAPLFVLVAGIGLSLGAGAGAGAGPRPLGRTAIAARAPLLLVLGMALSLGGDGVILQSFALFFVVGACTLRLPRWALLALAGSCLVGGPLFLTLLRRHAALPFFGSQHDVGFHGLIDPVGFGRGLLLSYYPAVIWLGFLFVGMVLGRGDLGSAAAGRRLFGWAAPAAVVLFTVGWAGARAFSPASDTFALAPPPLMTWSQHWTTYGFSDSIGWALSSTALALAVVGGCVWIAGARRPLRPLAPLSALGAMSLTFYVVHFAYLGTVWTAVRPHVTNLIAFLAASIAIWLIFAAAAQRWLARFRRGPLEAAMHAGAAIITAPWARVQARERRATLPDGVHREPQPVSLGSSRPGG